jgi:hypothetical protein
MGKESVIQLRELTWEHPAPDRSVFSHTLPCGHTLSHGVKFRPPTPADQALHDKRREDMAQYWVNSRLRRHECRLVSYDNPMGLKGYNTFSHT